jgi:hypothetical protein
MAILRAGFPDPHPHPAGDCAEPNALGARIAAPQAVQILEVRHPEQTSGVPILPIALAMGRGTAKRWRGFFHLPIRAGGWGGQIA